MRITRYMTVCACWVLGSLPMLAAVPQPGAAPQQTKSLIYGAYIVTGVMLAAVCAACFKSSKRSHQD